MGLSRRDVERVEQLLNKKSLMSRRMIETSVSKSYQAGLERGEVALNMNFTPNRKAIEFLQGYTFDLVQGVNDDMRKTLVTELKRAFMNNLTAEETAEALRKKLDLLQSRARTIARTELNRAENAGHYQAGEEAEKLGINVVKEWFNPSPSAPVCVALAGSTKPMDEDWTFEGTQYSAPPAHPNCRSRLLIKQV